MSKFAYLRSDSPESTQRLFNVGFIRHKVPPTNTKYSKAPGLCTKMQMFWHRAEIHGSSLNILQTICC